MAKYTKKHIKAVFERLLQYEFTIVSGINCLEDCEICATVPGRCLMTKCVNCLLNQCSDDTISATGLTLAWEDGFDVFVDSITQRYPELCDLIEKHGFPVERLEI